MSTAATTIPDVAVYCRELADQAVAAGRSLATVSGAQRATALQAVADKLLARADVLKAENVKDLDAGRNAGLSAAMLDRLALDDQRIASMADSVRQIADQVDPIGQVIEERVRPNGLRIEKVRVPIGVVLIIFESRPNVTSDAAALCINSGNAVILRGGKEALHSNAAIAGIVRDGLTEAGISADTVQLVSTTDRAAVGELLRMEGKIDVAIPRGGESLIRAVVEQANIPVIKHYTGNCHIFVDGDCDADMAVNICVNAKTQRPGVCNAVETILFHRDHIASGLLAKACRALADKGVEIRGCEDTCAAFAGANPASDSDWDEEFLDLIVAVKVVNCVNCAIGHINTHGSKHTDAIITRSTDTADRFVARVDSANTFVNCSTRFSDGGEYGLGAEIGISTDKLHARGPMGAADLTTYKWVVHGEGQIRT